VNGPSRGPDPDRPRRLDERIDLDDLTIETAPPDEREAALALLLSHLPAAERAEQVRELLGSASAGALSLDGLLVARSVGRRVAAGFFVPQPGRVAFVWPPAVDDDSPSVYADVARAILNETARRLDAAGVRIGQCLLDPAGQRERMALDECGFLRVTELEFLHRALDEGTADPTTDPIETVSSPDDWRGEPFTPNRDEGLFADLLERTTIGTADCPELNGLRDGAEALAGHRASGEFDPALWLCYRAGGAAAAALLMTAHSDRNAWEIVYLGVVPEHRGRGWGRLLVSDALARARRAGQGGVFLAVDCRNTPARRLYEQAGFRAIGRQAVHLRLTGRTESTAYAPDP
jgi:ribosomal protein S18 acetylase RimI-like enzyme